MDGTRRFPQLLLAAAAVALLGIAPSPANGRTQQTIDVATPAEFAAALGNVQPGGTIRLVDRDWPALEVRDRQYDKAVKIAGTRNARLLYGLTIVRSSNVTVTGLTVTPEVKPNRADMTPSVLSLDDSTNVVLTGLLVTGEARVYTCPGEPHDICPEAGAWIEIAGSSSGVAIKKSEIAKCRRTCVQSGGTGLTIADNTFHDSLGGHFVGTIASDVTIRRNAFDRALDPDCVGTACPRGPEGGQHIRINGGGPWTIVSNRFGENQDAASVRVEPIANPTPIRDVTIASNVFFTTGQGLSGVEIVAAARDLYVPLNSRVVNNTILTKSSGVKLGDGWEKVDAGKRPIVANNILKAMAALFCDRGNFRKNLSMGSEACNGVELGQANLDADHRPTGNSNLVIDRADPEYAPERDYLGKGRVGAPDLGAFEYRG